MLWPFARYLGNYERELAIFREDGGDLSSFADPDARVSKDTARRMTVASLEKTGDLCLGLHAGECVELSDFGVPDQLTRYCSTLREAILLNSRYVRLQEEGLRCGISEEDDTATLYLHNEDPNRIWVVHEYQVASTLKRLSLYTRGAAVPLEVHLRHANITDAGEYARVFKCPLRMEAACNAVVMSRHFLDFRALRPNPNLVIAFEQQAARALEKLGRAGSFADKVRPLIRAGLERGLNVADAAGRLHVSEATLRRRLADEGTTYKAVLDGVRRDLAFAHLAAKLDPGEVAFALGYSNFNAFARAFRRWTGTSPAEYLAGDVSGPD
jgi:AraC-like DNA-binding protein